MDFSTERLQYRGKTAIGRPTFSRPIKLALRDRIITSEKTVLDYGCGRGGDVSLLNSIGIDSVGWDPNHFADGIRLASDVVNLGYVINVIEDPAERVSVLKYAYSLANECLIVSAQTEATKPSKGVPYNDGILTTRKTFQKYFANEALRSLIESSTGARAFLVERGIFFVFKSEEARVRYALARLSRKSQFPSVRKLKSLKSSNDSSRDDVLISLAVERFRRSDILSSSRVSLLGCEEYFGSFENACNAADELLASLTNRAARMESMKGAPCGKMLPDSFYFHCSALRSMDIKIQTLVSCARTIADNIDGDFIVKIPKTGTGVSLLIYRDFENVPHPELMVSLLVDLEQRTLRTRSYSNSKNPPILHRKECFVLPDHPKYQAFRELTEVEEGLGLLSRSDIGFRKSWAAILKQISFDPNKFVSKKTINPDSYPHI